MPRRQHRSCHPGLAKTAWEFHSIGVALVCNVSDAGPKKLIQIMTRNPEKGVPATMSE